MNIIELENKIQDLIKYASKLGERSKNLNKLLYKQLDEVNELTALDNLNGDYLEAYLLWKSIKRANYQPEHMKLTSYNRDKLLEIISAEIQNIEKENQKEISSVLTDEQLLGELDERVTSGRIKL